MTFDQRSDESGDPAMQNKLHVGHAE